jgi:hypothetical protein
MLKSLEELLLGAERIATQHPFIGFVVMGLAGGIIGTIKLYERAGFNMSLKMLAARFAVKAFMGVFVGLLIFLAWRVLGWRLEYGFIVAAVGGIFSTEFLELVFVSGVEWFRKRGGLPGPAPKLDERHSSPTDGS